MFTSPNSAIALDPVEWYYANWRNLPPLPRQPDDKFKVAAAVKHLNGKWMKWRRDLPISLDLKPDMSKQEAQFWARVCVAMIKRDLSFVEPFANPELNSLVDKIDKCSFSNLLTVSAITDKPQQVVALIKARYSKSLTLKSYDPIRADFNAVATTFRRNVRPYLDASTLEDYRTALGESLSSLTWTGDHSDMPNPLFEIAACLGCNDVILPIVENMAPDYTAAPWYQHGRPSLWLVCGLTNPQDVIRHKRRLELGLDTPEQGRAWIAHTEANCLDDISDAIKRLPTSFLTIPTWVKTLGCVDVPETAVRMVELIETGIKRGTGDWLDAHPASTALGLASLCAQTGPAANIAVESLTRLLRLGKTSEVNNAIEKLIDDDATIVRKRLGLATTEERPAFVAFDDSTTPSWLTTALKRIAPVNLPWVSPTDLPPIVVDGFMLNPDQVARLLFAMTKAKADVAPPLVEAVKHHADGASLANFAWAVFECWAHGGKTREHWIIYTVARYADNKTAVKVGKLAFQAGLDKRWGVATNGLEVLQTMATDTAIAEIYRFAKKSASGYIKDKADAALKAAAAARGLSTLELEDRTVPDCGLDATGSRVLDFGPRQFKVVLAPDAKPAVRDDNGKIKSDLPKPSSTDDPIKSAEAVDDWKVMKRQLASVIRAQVGRLEEACITERSWSREEFEICFVRHPVLLHLARMVVWALYDPQVPTADYSATFRVTEDRTFANAADSVITLPEGRVCLAHPARLSPDLNQQWIQILDDYEIATPFQQTGRPIRAVDPKAVEETSIKHFADTSAPAAAVVYGLEKLGWERIGPLGGGIIPGHLRYFFRDGITAVTMYEPGAFIGDIAGSQDQIITSVVFVRCTPEEYLNTETPPLLPLGNVGPVAYSEVVFQLSQITKKAI